jgi:sugar phosphate permease
MVASGASAMYVPLVSIIARWFIRRRGLMSGIGVSGIGFGIGIMPIISSRLIEEFQWRTSLLFIGGASIVLIVLLAQLLKTRPASQSISIESKGRSTGIPIPAIEYSFSEAVKTKQFWLIFVAWIGYGFFFQIGTVHIVPYASDIGMNALAAATILSIMGLIGTPGRVILGLLGDKIGNSKAVYLSFAVMGLAYLGLSLSNSIPILYMFAIIFGFLFGIGILLAPVVAEYFGLKALGSISGTMVFAHAIGGAIGPPVAGAIFDINGNYDLAFTSCVAVAIAAALCMWFLKPVSR